MKQPMKLHDYQLGARRHSLLGLLSNNSTGLWLSCGLGKSAITLHVIKDLLDLNEIRTTLIVAPLRVIQTVWRQESKEWDLPLTFDLVHGTPKKRLQSLGRAADIYLTSYGLLDWMSKQDIDFDMVVFDENTKVKNW